MASLTKKNASLLRNVSKNKTLSKAMNMPQKVAYDAAQADKRKRRYRVR